jgi:hypothetical protein
VSVNIINFIKKMLPIFKKADILEDMETSLESIETTVIPSLIMLEDLYKLGKPLSKEAKAVAKTFYENVAKSKSGIALSRNEDLASDLLSAFKTIKLNGEYVLDSLDSVISDAVMSEALSALKAFLFRAVAHYSFMAKFATDLNNYILIKEAELANKDLGDKYKLNKKQTSSIEENMWVFSRLVSFYGQTTETFKAELENIPDILLPKGKVDEVIDNFTESKIEPISTIPTGFVGSPIYSIRLVFAQWEADRYKESRDKKRLLELRYLHLKMLKERGDSDVNLEKEIEILQREVTDLDYKISKMEEGLDD